MESGILRLLIMAQGWIDIRLRDTLQVSDGAFIQERSMKI